jgi:hypothetical protein
MDSERLTRSVESESRTVSVKFCPKFKFIRFPKTKLKRARFSRACLNSCSTHSKPTFATSTASYTHKSDFQPFQTTAQHPNPTAHTASTTQKNAQPPRGESGTARQQLPVRTVHRRDQCVRGLERGSGGKIHDGIVRGLRPKSSGSELAREVDSGRKCSRLTAWS